MPFREYCARGDFLVTAEITPPKGPNIDDFLAKALLLKGWVHGVNVTDSNRAVMRMSPVVASLLLQRAGLEPICQLACRDRNQIALQGDLLGAAALGIDNILALTGDPVTVGDHPQAKSVCDLESVRLLQVLRQLNQGQDWSGHALNQPTQFFSGAAVDPQCPSLSGLKGRFSRKIAAGAEFFQTQMITDFDQFARFMDQMGYAAGKPILAGVFLLKSAKNAQFINRNLPGVQIPDHLINRLAAAAQPLEEGIRICAEQVQQAQKLCQGVHLMAVRREDLIPRILAEAGITPTM
ncbi:methylenetetrahydrofolate reductase [Candidatus Cyanaurora vandensis]|uniref:methylenetetrahydrofolate reductase n=1 Tax=Candidatus Cyanaurora vandensis TaxID=2714958 RepID=UPI002580667C|nr:methylenetetrahydrofolate reductase [Candidatus Cyanaurora vandensis]